LIVHGGRAPVLVLLQLRSCDGRQIAVKPSVKSLSQGGKKATAGVMIFCNLFTSSIEVPQRLLDYTRLDARQEIVLLVENAKVKSSNQEIASEQQQRPGSAVGVGRFTGGGNISLQSCLFRCHSNGSFYVTTIDSDVILN
jgi:hypothetical protein